MTRDAGVFVVFSIALNETGRLELRRFSPAGAAWFLVGEEDGEPREIAVPEAAAVAGSEGWWDVLQATRAELEYQDEAGTWTGRLDTPHPSADRLVQGLCAGWVEAWDELRAAEESTPRPSIPAFGVLLALDRAHESGNGSLRMRVIAHGGACDHAATISAVLDDLAARVEGTVAVFDSANAYVQIMDRKQCPTVYLEAVDPAYQGGEPLVPDQRERLAELGWTDPKTAPIPYESAHYGNEWAGGNFAREWPRNGTQAELVAAIVETLEVYGLEPDEALGVTIFPSVA